MLDQDQTLQKVGKWVKKTLEERGIEKVAKWDGLEYWAQVELYRSLTCGELKGFKGLGGGEVRYYTNYSYRSKDKAGVKGADLLAISEDDKEALWFELKDLMRLRNRIMANCAGVGKDLMALAAFHAKKTFDALEKPNVFAKNKGTDGRMIDVKNVFEKGKTHHNGLILALQYNKPDQNGETVSGETCRMLIQLAYENQIKNQHLEKYNFPSSPKMNIDYQTGPFNILLGIVEIGVNKAIEGT